MKKLYYSVCSLATPHMDVLLNAIGNDIESGHEVVFAYCDEAMHSCFKNMEENAGLCKLCRFTYNHCIIPKLNGVKLLPVRVEQHNSQYDNLLNYHSSKELKELRYKGVCVGMSVLSHYFTRTRKVDVDLDKKNKFYFDKVIKETCAFIDKIDMIIEDIKPDCIAFHNGRYYENRPLLDIAKKRGIHFESYEVIGGPRTGRPYAPVKFDNCLPHDIHWFARTAETVWNVSDETEEKKIEVSSSFYEKRRHGMVAGDIAYTKSQQEGLLPDVETSKKNIVVFNSSTDEIAAIGDEWDAYQLFESQYDALDYILSKLTDDYHVYLRIHPNLANVQQKHHTDLYKLEEKYCNVTIIPPTSPISSYALLDIADKVLVFGSTMGVEACYWGKPVVLVGAAFYLDLDVCYRATDKENLMELLLGELSLKNKIGCMKYAYYLLDYNYRVEPVCSNIDTDFEPTPIKVLGKELTIFKSYKLFGSHKFFKLVVTIWRQLICPLYRNRNVLPS